jgi:hypothetical protein
MWIIPNLFLTPVMKSGIAINRNLLKLTYKLLRKTTLISISWHVLTIQLHLAKVFLFGWWRAPQQMLRTHRSLKAYCVTLWWRWSVFFFFVFLSNGAPVEWNWLGKTEVLGEKPVPVPLCPPQIPGGSRYSAYTQAFLTSSITPVTT